MMNAKAPLLGSRFYGDGNCEEMVSKFVRENASHDENCGQSV